MKFVKNINEKFRVFTFKPSKKIVDLYSTFDSVRNTNDPNILMDFLATNPYYPEAVYAMAEYYRLKGDFKHANFMMEKCIFFFEESLSFEFKIFKEDIKNSKEYCILEADPKNIFNMLFFKCLLKFTVILLKKSCY